MRVRKIQSYELVRRGLKILVGAKVGGWGRKYTVITGQCGGHAGPDGTAAESAKADNERATYRYDALY